MPPNNKNKWDNQILVEALKLFPSFQDKIDKKAKLAPAPITQLIEDRDLAASCSQMPVLFDLQKDVRRVSVLVKTLEDSELLVRQEIRDRTKESLATISEQIKTFWSELHPSEPIENVSVCMHGDQDKTIDVSLNFFGVNQQSPRLTLSEGHRNSLGLSIFLSLAKLNVDNGPIILDDVVSSLDREHRGMLAGLILKHFSDRQILLLTHDREWYSELRYRLPSSNWKFLVLRPWNDPTTGLRWSNSTDTFDDALDLVGTNPAASGNRTRVIMDMQLALAAEKLEVELPYLRGDKNDHRTGVDFLQRIIRDAPRRLRKKQGKEWLPYSDPITDWTTAQTLLVSWGDRASHTESMTKAEAEEFVRVCRKALSHFRCETCGNYIWTAKQTSNDRLQCSCGCIQWREL